MKAIIIRGALTALVNALSMATRLYGTSATTRELADLLDITAARLADGLQRRDVAPIMAQVGDVIETLLDE